MRVLVIFDLPMQTSQERREYSKFRKFLIKNGFLMLQKSVYAKLALNTTAVDAIMDLIRKNQPAYGLVQMISITEKQFNRMEFVVGESSSELLDSTDRVVFL